MKRTDIAYRNESVIALQQFRCMQTFDAVASHLFQREKLAPSEYISAAERL